MEPARRRRPLDIQGAESDAVRYGLKEELDRARSECSEAWKAFDDERTRLDTEGVDLFKNREARSRLDELKKSYDKSASYQEGIEEGLNRIYEREVDGTGTGRSAHGIGAEFLRRIGAGVAGLKALDGTSGGTMVPPFFSPDILKLPTRQLFVRSLIPVTKVSGDKIWYLQHTAYTNAAAAVAAGGLKPTSVLTVTRIEDTVRTIAHVSEALDRALLSDFDALVNFIESNLRMGVLLAEENQILNGNGTSPNLRGILNTVGIGTQAVGADNRADAIHKAINACRLALFEPDAIVLHPTDWQTVRLQKNANGDYYTGDAIQGDPDRLWGKQVITSPVIAQGTGLVGAFAVGAQLWDREEARVTFTESGLGDSAGQELFSRNQIRFRAEERVSFGVPYPTAFCSVSGL